MIYLDTSVALAHLLAEDQVPSPALWDFPLITSRLLEYEVWTWIHARGLTRSHADVVRELVARLAMIELASPILVRALEPFPAPVRTLDALHLSSIEFLREHRQDVRLASYDARQIHAAKRLGIDVVDPSSPK